MDKKILIVEDDPSLRKALHDKLKSEDFKVLEAEDGQQGLKTAIDKEPDLILLDILMPKMDGFKMTEELRKHESSKGVPYDNQIPIIYLTNLGEEKGLGQSEKHGVYDYLIKANWNLESVVKKIKDKLKI